MRPRRGGSLRRALRSLVRLLLALVVAAGSASTVRADDGFGKETPYGTPTAAVQPPPEGYELLQLQVVSRHGARSLTSDGPERRTLTLWERARSEDRLTPAGTRLADDVRAFQRAERRIGYGHLSTLGVQEWHDIGTRLASSYRDFLTTAQSDGDRIAYVTTDVERTVESADAERAAFREAGLTALDDRSTSTEDPSLAFPAGASAEGEAAIEAARARPEVMDAARRVLRRTYDEAFVATVEDPVQAALDVDKLYATAAGMALDTDVTFAAYLPEGQRESLAEVVDTENFYRFGPGVAGQRSSFAAADPLLRSVFAAADRRIAGGDEAAVLRHAHGETTMPFAARLRLVGSDRRAATTRPYRYDDNPWRGATFGGLATNIEWALYRRGARHLVAIRLDEEPTTLTGCRPTDTWFYDLEELRRCLDP